ncbi:MAG: hypothetical protein JXP39_09755 [Spirochaetales bacterium]|nr:hypothetical protein [Spirochaetales bacterium]
MRRGKNAKKKTLPPLDMVSAALMIVGTLIFAAIVTGTLWAFASGRANPRSLLGIEERRGGDSQGVAVDGESLFSGIGTLRIPLSGDKPATLVVRPYLTIPAGDRPFAEELSRKTPEIRDLFREWCSSRTARELAILGENAVKKSLLAEINAHLVLGSAGSLYFSEYEIFQ